MHAVQVRVRSVLWAVVMTALVVGNARAADRFVSTAGSDAANDCLSSASPCRTVGQGLAQAASGDTVKVAEGSYREHLTVTDPTTLTLSGGWANDFSVQDPITTPTVLGAPRPDPYNRNALHVEAHGVVISFTADGLTFQDGAHPSFGQTPALFVGARAGGSLSALLSRLTLQRNELGMLASAGDAGTSMTLTVIDSVIARNSTRGIILGFGNGGTGEATLDRLLVEKNRTGGIQIFASPLGHVVVQNSIFNRNQVGGSGGGISGVGNAGCDMGSCPLKVVNSVFTNNRAKLGAGINVDGGAELVNVTATRNVGRGPFGEGGGGVALASGTIRDSVLWGNGGVSPRDLVVTGFAGVGLDHSDVHDQGVFLGAPPATDLGGNIDADPLFVAAPRDIHLTAGSPAIDTGTCTGAPTTDFEGDPRPTGASCDMGADEFVP